MALYKPRDDSYLLAGEIKKYISLLKDKNIRVLDMGSGSGIQAETCIQAGIPRENILTADIDKEAVQHLKKKGFESIQSDLLSDIKGKFDMVIFNPPYLPESKYDKEKDTTGGKKGCETILRFLKQAKAHLNKDGRIFIVFSS
ncbi:methyltransferase, partial [Candidatus Pacearchaeota archaeon]|nr:methyltransferase [Candidatus Pacearchaeota archaeon]